MHTMAKLSIIAAFQNKHTHKLPITHTATRNIPVTVDSDTNQSSETAYTRLEDKYLGRERSIATAQDQAYTRHQTSSPLYSTHILNCSALYINMT